MRVLSHNPQAEQELVPATHRERDRETGRQRDRQTDRQTDTQPEGGKREPAKQPGRTKAQEMSQRALRSVRPSPAGKRLWHWRARRRGSAECGVFVVWRVSMARMRENPASVVVHRYMHVHGCIVWHFPAAALAAALAAAPKGESH